MNNKWWILFVTTAATSLVFLDNTVLPVSLPTIERELGFSRIGLIWVVNAYVLTLAALMIVGGRLYDLFGMRRTYLLGVFLFGLGSVLGGFSLAKWWLISGRVIQGLGGALLLPTTGAILIETFSIKERGKALGINTGISSIFLILGPALGGFFTEYLSWRYIFWINLPIVILGLLLGARMLPKGEKKEETFHFLGAGLFSLSMVSLVVALMQANSWGWASPIILGLLALFAIFFTSFMVSTRKATHPLLDLSLLSRRQFGGANLCILLAQVSLMGTVLWAIYFQNQLHFSPIGAGLLMLLATIPVILLAPVAGFLVDRYGPRVPISIGFCLLSLALAWLGMKAPFTDPFSLQIGLVPFGCGIALILSPSFVMALSDAPKEKLGMASSMTSTVRQISATLGIAMMTAVYQLMDNPTHGFALISFVGAALAIGGLLAVLLLLRKPAT